MSESLLDLLQPAGEAAPGRISGVVVGIVTNNDDPDGLGRVKVRFPWLSDSDESWWARLATPMAGASRGLYLLPEVDDEVLVAFEQGDARFPYVLGGLWNGQDAPPESTVLDGGQVVKRVFKTRSGHMLCFDDTDGSETITIVDKTGNNSIVFEASANTITIQADGDITLQSTQGKIVLKGQSVEVKAEAQDVKVEASANLELKANAQVNVQGAMINLN